MRGDSNRTHISAPMQVMTPLMEKLCLQTRGHNILKAIKNEHRGLYLSEGNLDILKKKETHTVLEFIWTDPILVKKHDTPYLNQSSYRK